MLALAPDGFEERTAADGGLEIAVYTDPEGEAAVRAAFGDVASAPVGEDWAERWRDFHQPVELGSLWIGPPWREPAPERIAVVVDPGRAFGTGAHDTTRLCLEQLERLPRGSLLDVGCGSGVLSIAAARLGYAPVTAVDNDANAVEATRENAARNDVVLDVGMADVLVDELPRAEVAVANVSLAVVAAVLPRLRTGWAVVSGFRAEDALDASGWEPVARAERSGWAVEVLRRPTG